MLTTCSNHFPKEINIGVATSAYQIEGAWNLDGKGESIWDNFTHIRPSRITNGATGDVACDSYHKYKEDVKLIANLGFKYYRFSVAWSRVLPTGYAAKINHKGIKYYKRLTNEIRKYGLIPVATLYHWDLPMGLLNDGIDWTNEKIIKHFVNYARIVIKHLPEVGIWVTINEPKQVCHFGYGVGNLPPAIASSGLLEYQCSYIVIKAHAAVYHMYKEEFVGYKAKMGLAPDFQWVEPVTNSSVDLAAMERQLQFQSGLYYHPIFKGDWPEIVKTRIAERSALEKYNRSRLPSFTNQEIAYIKGTSDFLALNHYITLSVSDAEEGLANVTSFNNDLRTTLMYYPSKEKGSNNWTITPWGIRKSLNWLQVQYGKQDFLITELGISDDGSSINDDLRIQFFTGMFCNIQRAVEEDGVNVVGVTVWSILDNFEWTDGYSNRFGVYYIDFTDPNRNRVPKKSAEFFKNLTKTRFLNCDGY